MRLGTSIPTMKVGSTAVAAIKRGSSRIYDPDVAAFQKASAAADVTGILDLVDYLKAESLWDYARFYPMKSAQNAGTGSTVYGLGGLTSNNMTLVNSPTWGSDGVTFDAASSQYAKTSDFIPGGDLFVFHKGSITTSTSALGQWSGDGDQRSFLIGRHTTGHVRIWASPDGVSASTSYIGDQYGGSTVALVVNFPSSGAPLLYREKVAEPLTLYTGSPVAQRHNSNAAVGVMAFVNNSGTVSPTSSGSAVVTGFIVTALTTTQRETITDLINAL